MTPYSGGWGEGVTATGQSQLRPHWGGSAKPVSSLSRAEEDQSRSQEEQGMGEGEGGEDDIEEVGSLG